MIETLNVPDAGSITLVRSLLENRTVTVFAALTQAENELLPDTDSLGTPRDTGSPLAAPVNVIVRSVLELGEVSLKLSTDVVVKVRARAYRVALLVTK